MPEEEGAPLPLSIRLLKWLVLALTATMIVGVITIVAVIVIRVQADAPRPILPETLVLPEGAEAQAVTVGPGWALVVTTDGRLLTYDGAGRLVEERRPFAAEGGG